MKKEWPNLQIQEIPVEGFEKVLEIREKSVSLHAIIAIHTTTLGPALGGVRVYPYTSFEDALFDVCRLAEGMTKKAAIAQTGTGGAKAVIIHEGKKSKELLHAFGAAVDTLKGMYICAEDVNMSVLDVEEINRVTPYVVGLPQTSGNPSIYTAWGTFKGVQAACFKLFGSPSPRGKRIAIQGLGSVGMELARLLFWEGAELIVADKEETLVQHAQKEFGAEVSTVDAILSESCDLLAPCAMGAILNPESIPKLRCKGIAGPANNQLLSGSDGDALFERGILYTPDYVINSGGLLNVCVEIEPAGYRPAKARDKVDHVYDVLIDIFEKAEKSGQSSHRIADEIAASNVAKGIGKRREEVVFHSKIV